MTTPTGEAPKRRRVRTDNSVKKLANGKGWRARPTLGTDPVTGKQVRPTKVFATKKAAQDWVTEQRSQWSTAAWTPKSPRTFDEVADHWLTLRAADPSIGPNTVRADRESLAYARKAFGAVPVQKLPPPPWGTGRPSSPARTARCWHRPRHAARSFGSSRSWSMRATCAG